MNTELRFAIDVLKVIGAISLAFVLIELSIDKMGDMAGLDLSGK